MRRTDPTADVFAAIADPTRRAMLERLAREGERNVTQLMAPFPMSQPAVSKHLRVLRDAGLVRRRKAGRENLYLIETDRLHEVRDWIALLEQSGDQRLESLAKSRDAK